MITAKSVSPPYKFPLPDLIEPVAPTRPPEMDAPAPTPPEQPEGGIETEMNPLNQNIKLFGNNKRVFKYDI